jgi:mannosyl-3-phosphoglycerate phosphatase
MFVVIFTDLDGTLLNHDDYSYEAALPALKRIKEAEIPLIIATSKTRSEVEFLQRKMGIIGPFIAENGGGIFIPKSSRLKNIHSGEEQGEYTLIRLGKSYENIRSLFGEMALRFEMKGFGDMTITEIAALLGLSEMEAERAKLREFTEPFLVEDEADIRSIEKHALSIGLKVAKGGRFYHLIDGSMDKGAAVRKVIELYRDNFKPAMLASIGIGDSENDLAMLEAVDIPVLIPNPHSRHHHFSLPGLVRAKESGSLGWNSALESILDRMNEKQHLPGSFKTTSR